MADELRQGFEANILKVPAVDAIPFENAVEAYERVASGTRERSRCSPSPSLIVPSVAPRLQPGISTPYSIRVDTARWGIWPRALSHFFYRIDNLLGLSMVKMIEHETE